MQLSADGTTIISVTNEDIHEGLFIIPDTVTAIGKEAFKGCTHLRKLSLPKNITLDEETFKECTGLILLNISEGTTINTHGVLYSRLEYIIVDSDQDKELSRIKAIFYRSYSTIKVFKKSFYDQIIRLQDIAYQQIVQEAKSSVLFPIYQQLGLVADVLPLISACEGKDSLAYQLFKKEVAAFGATSREIEGELEAYEQYLNEIVEYVKSHAIAEDQTARCVAKLNGYVYTMQELIAHKKTQHPGFFASKEALHTKLNEQLAAVQHLILYLQGDKHMALFSSAEIEHLSQGYVGQTLVRFNVDLTQLPSEEKGPQIICSQQ